MTISNFVSVPIFSLLVSVCSSLCVAQVIYEFDNSVEVVANSKKLTLPWAGGINSGQYQTIDLNRDGEDDLVVFDRTSIKVNTFIWTSEGYIYDPDYEALFPDDLNAWLVIVDFNCDGIEDLVSSSVFGMKAYVGNLQHEKLEWSLSVDPITTEGFSSQVNLQVNSADIPAIVDIDNDGDLDIFVFNFARGGTIEYHQNLSMENTGQCGLTFKRVNSVWGNFEECTCGVYALGISCSEMTGRDIATPGKVLHAGGKSLLLFDYDGDGDKDMLFGDEECVNLAYFENTETDGDADFNNYIFEFPVINPANYLFPAAYLLDIDHDGLDDLVIAPNLSDNGGNKIDFVNSSSVYRNTGTAERFQFQLQKNDFLQDEMIEVGFNAAVALHDVDKDGKADLIIGNGGRKKENDFRATLTYYKNTGSRDQPEFTLQSEDFLNLSASGLTNINPGFADLNGDGADDLYFKGTAADGSTSLYYVLGQDGGLVENAAPALIAVPLGNGDKPVLNHLNADDFADLLIFRSSGRMDYYENRATNGNVDFKPAQENFAGFTEKFENRNLTPAIFDIDANGLNELVISNGKGQLFIIEDYFNHQSALEGTKQITIRNSKWDDTSHKAFGFGSNIAFASLFHGELPSMVVGSRQGGVYLLRNKNGSVAPGEDSFSLTCSPVPSEGTLNVEVSQTAEIVLYNTLGEIVWEVWEQSGGVKYGFNTSELVPGVYIVKAISNSGKRKVRKIIVL